MTSGYFGQGSVMLRIERQGEKHKVTQLWKNTKWAAQARQALLHEGHLDGNSADLGGGLRCLTLDGEVQWDSKAGHQREFDLGNLIIAGGADLRH